MSKGEALGSGRGFRVCRATDGPPKRDSGDTFDLRFEVGYCPHPVTVYIRVLLRAMYSHIVIIIQLLLSGGSTQV